MSTRIYVPTQWESGSSMKTAYVEGFRACGGKTSNPYAAGSWEAKAWKDGWTKAETKLKDGERPGAR